MQHDWTVQDYTLLISAITAAMGSICASVVTVINAANNKRHFQQAQQSLAENTQMTTVAARNAAQAVGEARAANILAQTSAVEIKQALVKCIEVHTDLADQITTIVSQAKKGTT